MIGLNEYDAEQQSKSELPEKPLKEWRRKFESGSLDGTNLMQYFQAASPFFFTIDQTSEYPTELGMKYFSIHFIQRLIRIFILQIFQFANLIVLLIEISQWLIHSI